jgi:HSP20 family protein
MPVFRDLRREVERLFDSYVPGGAGGPAMNIWEDGDTLHAEVEVPGMTMKDIEVSVIGAELTIKGERKPMAGEKLAYHRQERVFGSLSRTLTLPYEINADAVEATLRDGVLTIRLPKAESARARRIAVKAV